MPLTKAYFRELNQKAIETTGEIVVKEADSNVEGLSTFSYVHGGVDFTQREVRLARGLTLDENDKVVLVGFEKFFCNRQLDNREYLAEYFKEEYARLQPKAIYKAIEKLDGTMIILGLYKGEFITSTTFSTKTPFAKNALDYFNALENKEEIKNYLKARNSCFVFEYISLYNKIAVEYKTKQDYVLLAEISKDTLKPIEIANSFKFTRPDIQYLIYEQLEDIQKNGKGIEGFVVENDYGRLIKVKTDWWYEEHFKATLFFHPILTKNQMDAIVDCRFNNTLDELYALQNRSETLRKEDRVGKVEQVINELLKEGFECASQYDSLKDFYILKWEKGNDVHSIAVALLSQNHEDLKKMLKKILYKRILGL